MKLQHLTLTAFAMAVSVASLGCRREKVNGTAPPPVSTTTVTSAPTWPVARPTRVAVEGDRALHVAHAPPGERRAIVYLHGMCSTPQEDVADIAEVARAHGTVIALEADQPCGDGTNKWPSDETAIQSRIDAALAAVARARGGDLETAQLTIVGESQGASRAEALANKYGERYPYVVLFGAPTRAKAESFEQARAVAVVAAERESQLEQQASVDVLTKQNIKSRFFEIPLAVHGTIGAEGGAVMDEALTFLGR